MREMSNVCKERRMTLKRKCPNPLFEKWLEEWTIECESKGSEMQYYFLKALKSLKMYPLPLQTGKDCAILQGFGTKLCVMLDKKLDEHKKNVSSGVRSDDISNKNLCRLYEIREVSNVRSNNSIQNCNKNTECLEKSVNSKKTHRQYIPVPRTGPYVLLLTLHKISQTRSIQESTKQNIIHIAQQFYEKPRLKSNSNSHHTVWPSIRTLISKKLVEKHINPTFFTLTDLGKRLACQLYENDPGVSSNYSSFQEDCIDENILNGDLRECNKERRKNSNLNNEIESKKINNPQVEFNLNPNENVMSNGTERKDIDKETGLENNIESIQCDNVLINRERNFINDRDKSNTIVFEPRLFNIILLVDTQETAGKKKHLDDVTLNELTRAGIMFEVRHLSIGDFTWIARDSKNQELVLPYIIERKRMDDFGSSIKDGRFHEQKFRLKQCGIQNLIYMVENCGNNQHTGLPLSTLYQAATNTLIQDRFSVKYTLSLKQSIIYVATLTKILCDIYQEKILIGYADGNAVRTVPSNDGTLLTFSEFNKNAAKTKNFKVKDVFARHLIQLKGISRDMVIAIVDKYPTPKCLVDAYKGNSDALNEKLLTTIKYGPLKRYIGPVISKTVFSLYSKHKFSEN